MSFKRIIGWIKSQFDLNNTPTGNPGTGAKTIYHSMPCSGCRWCDYGVT